MAIIDSRTTSINLRLFLNSLLALGLFNSSANGGVILENADDFKLVILHTNDMHSRVLPVNAQSGSNCNDDVCYGGFARLKFAADKLRREYEDAGWQVLFLNAGDTFQGSPYFTVHGWKVFAELVPLLGFDASCLGNHEFDRGPPFLVEYLKALKSNPKPEPVLSCNVDTSKESAFAEYKLERSTILTKKGRKIGIIGYVTPDTKHLAKTGNVVIEEEVTAIRREVDDLKKQDVNILIALGHSGYWKDMDIAQEVTDLDAVVGGHTNTFLFTGPKPCTEDIIDDYPTKVKGKRTTKDGRIVDVDVPVVQAFAYTKYIGVLKLVIDKEGVVTKAEGNPVLLRSDNYGEDKDMINSISKWRKDVDDLYKQIIGYTEVTLEGDAVICRHRECNLGNLVADALVNFNADEKDSTLKDETLIAFYQAGSIRATIPKGPISYGDLLSAFPFSNEIKAVKVNGDIVRRCLEHSVRYFTPGSWNPIGNYLQVSGMKLYYDFSRKPMERLAKALIKCDKKQLEANAECEKNGGYAPLEVDRDYFVVTLSELLNGSDGYEDLKNHHTVVEGFGKSQLETLVAYLKKNGKVNPVVEGRTVFINRKKRKFKEEKSNL